MTHAEQDQPSINDPQDAGSSSTGDAHTTAPPAVIADPSPAPRRPKRGWRRVVFPLLAIVLGLAFVVAVEILLWAFDIADPADVQDPLVGFGTARPLFELDSATQEYHTAASRSVYFGTQEFPARKPTGQFRAFCLGGSTVRGRPYRTETSFAKWLEFELAGRCPGQDFQVVNCGGLSYASFRLIPVLREVLAYEPDLIVLATGHNEFLEDRTFQDIKSRSSGRRWLEEQVFDLRLARLIGQLKGTATTDAKAGKPLPEDVEARLDEASGYASYHRNDDWRKQVVAQFGRSVGTIVEMCRSAGVPLVLVQLGGNLRDCPPFKSEHRADLEPKQQQEWQRAFEAGTRAEEHDIQEALEHYQRAAQIDDQFALLHFRIAQCLDFLQQFDAARDAYVRARELDICPLRKVQAIGENLAKIAEQQRVPLVDAESAIRQLSLNGIPGYREYVDHVHPSIGMHQLIGRLVAEEVLAQEWIAASGDWPDGTAAANRRQIFYQHFTDLGPTYLSNGSRRLGWLEDWARRHRLADETIPLDVRGFVQHGHRQLGFGRIAAAWDLYKMAIEDDPLQTDALLDHAHYLMMQGRIKLARSLLERMQAELTAPVVQTQSALALLIVARVLGDAETEQELLDAFGARLNEVAESMPKWQKTDPDLIPR